MKTPLLFSILILIFFGCKPEMDCCVMPPANYLPLQVGNYWKVDNDDYIEITGKAQLADGEYFVLSSFIKNVPDPAFATQLLYMRIDEKQNLVQGFKGNNFTRIVANFALKEGEKLAVYDNLTVLEKNNTRMKFRHDCLVCSFYPSYYESTFLNGRGFADRSFFLAGNFGLIKPFKEVRINGVVSQL